MLFSQNRDELRRMYFDAWHKRRNRMPASPLETQIADAIELHPEYHALFDDPNSALDRDWQPEGGATNPFLHLGLHLAVRDQIATDRPAGLRAAFQAVATRTGDTHRAEHLVIDCLAQALWTAQRSGIAPDEQAYLRAVQQLSS